MLPTDKMIWEVAANPSSVSGRCYRVVSGSSVIADELTLAVATQIVDEHIIVRRLVDAIAEREATPMAVSRAPL